MTRRHFFGAASTGIGTAALASLFAREGLAAPSSTSTGYRGLPGLPHWAPKAKRVIYLFQSGAPSHIDLFENKPELVKRRGEDLPDSVRMGQRLTTMTAGKPTKLLPAIKPLKQYGPGGMWLSDLLPHTAANADKLCFIRSMHTDAINHAPATTFCLTGAEQPGRPSMGAWLSYGLGSTNDNLPTFCVMTSRDKEASCGQLFFDFYWGSGFLPSRYQGVQFRGAGDPVLYLSDPTGLKRAIRRGQLDDLARLNTIRQDAVGDPEITTRIAQYEMAYRMQTSVPALTDITTEPKHILEMYGPDVHRRGSFAQNCLLARRLAEQGVRFVQLMHAGWDQHKNLFTQLAIQCQDTDQPSAALVRDLEQRGLLDDTLVIWGGEFGRTVFSQGDVNKTDGTGRDHHPRCFTLWMAGGGVKPGYVHGSTDDFGYNVATDPVSVYDLQATILNLLGIHHEKLTYQYQGRHFRLTDVHGASVGAVMS
ncbi:MAG: DUF1501 domain-containing protein [Planctomycetes bacterium]|nr:DUF1501 domain-containing protein [Planctomycetota bacterium]